MKYITSCPECKTQFLLNSEHLKAHRGKVQCGHCEHVFNAKNRLTEISDDIHSAEEYQASLEAVEHSSGEFEDYFNTLDIEEIEITNDPKYIGEFHPEPLDLNYETSELKPATIEDFAATPKLSRRKNKHNIWLSLFSLLLVIVAGLV